ncbi:MAG: thioredoxin family protein [Alphaproteobacteria bacterium]|nr:thioredoxin family protein [Alphaproteobacteria bacterium]
MTARRLIVCLVLLAALLGGQRLAFGMASGWATSDQVNLRIVSSVDGVGERKSITLGLQFKMQPGWKIYWRSPGDAGYPPRVDWQGSQNLKSAEIEWPIPTRFSILGLETLGYKDEVILPLDVKVEEPGKPVTLHADVSYLTCAEICVPLQANLSLHLPSGPAEPSKQANLLARYAAQVPHSDQRHGLSIGSVSMTPIGDEVALNVEAKSVSPFAAPDLYVEGPEGSYFTKPKVSLADDGHIARLSMRGGGVPVNQLEATPLRVTLVDRGRALEESINPGRPAEGEAIADLAASTAVPPLVYIVVLALLGGLILNLMPCVLPVISIKLLNVVGHGGADRGRVRAGFVAAAAGIVFSMLCLAVFLILLKNAGMTIGWGIQFQQPIFLVFLVAVLTLFACNLMGLFEIQLPGRIAGFAERHGQGSSLTGHFMTGVFATLLATPCSAPFLGTAVGFALSQGTTEIFVVFTALAVGLALPYLVVAAFPGMATRLPRPGPWMAVLRRILGLALVATAIWLLTILYAVVGPSATIAVTALMLLVPAVFWARRLPGTRIGRFAGVVATGLAVAAILVPVVHAPAPDSLSGPTLRAEWRPFDEAEIPRLVAEGKVVLVDVTADWCITCEVNKKLVLETDEISEILGGASVVAMQADWTRPDPKISKFLARYGRYGIPFNIVFGPKTPGGVLLPELLTKNAVRSALVEAGADKAVVSR